MSLIFESLIIIFWNTACLYSTITIKLDSVRLSHWRTQIYYTIFYAFTPHAQSLSKCSPHALHVVLLVVAYIRCSHNKHKLWKHSITYSAFMCASLMINFQRATTSFSHQTSYRVASVHPHPITPAPTYAHYIHSKTIVGGEHLSQCQPPRVYTQFHEWIYLAHRESARLLYNIKDNRKLCPLLVVYFSMLYI